MGWEEGQLAGMAVLELSVCGMDELHAPSTMPLPLCVSTCGVLRVAASSCHRDALLPGKLGQFQG